MADISTTFKFIKGIILAKAGIKIPLRVTQDITRRCNLNCRYCQFPQQDTEMSTEEVLNIMDEFKDLGTISWGFAGGEPLMRKDIGLLVKHAKKSGFITSLVTNGTMLTENIEKIQDVDLLGISLDGPRDINDALRGKGVFDKAVDGLKSAQEKGIKCIVLPVLTKFNIDHIPWLIEFADSLGCRINFLPLITRSAQVDKESLLPEIKLYRDAIKNLLRLKKKNSCIFNTTNYLKALCGYPEKYPRLKCFAGTLFFYVTVEGKIKPCWNVPDEKTYTKDELNKILKQIPSQKNCPGCWESCVIEYNMLFKPSLKAWYDLMTNLR